MKPTTAFRKIFNAFCERQGKSNDAVRFLFDGNRIDADSTPADLDMEDGDRIDATVEMIGGRY